MLSRFYRLRNPEQKDLAWWDLNPHTDMSGIILRRFINPPEDSRLFLALPYPAMLEMCDLKAREISTTHGASQSTGLLGLIFYMHPSKQQNFGMHNLVPCNTFFPIRYEFRQTFYKYLETAETTQRKSCFICQGIIKVMTEQE